MIVEAKDVRFFEIRKISTDNGESVRIKGLVFHSSLAVDRIDISRAGADAKVLVHLTPARKGLSGSFNVDVPVENGVKRLLFGPSDVQIWPVKD